jgi:hypothetical protein
VIRSLSFWLSLLLPVSAHAAPAAARPAARARPVGIAAPVARLAPAAVLPRPSITALSTLPRPALQAPRALPLPDQRPAPLPGLRVAAEGVSDPARAPAGLAASFDGLRAQGEASPVSADGAVLGFRPLSSIERLKLGTYNVLNLFEMVGKWVPDPKTGRRTKVADRKPKEEWQLRQEAKAILDSDLDLVTLEEVENVKALAQFADRYLEGKYRPLLIEGNDERGIDVGFLVKKDIPVDIEHRSHKDRTWVDPLGDGTPTKLFSRDLPALIVRAPGQSRPLFIQLGTHYKSKRSRGSEDPESEGLRRAQVEETAKIIGELRAEFGQDVPLMLAGDFNGDVQRDSTFAAIKQAGMTDALDLADPPLTPLERVTHTYHPKGGPTHKAQMDAIFVSETMKSLVKMARVYRYLDAQGREKPLPETYEDRAKNPSDHFPVLVTIEFQPLVKRSVPLAR